MEKTCVALTLCFVFAVVSSSPLLFKSSNSREPEKTSSTQRTRYNADESVIKGHRKSRFECSTGLNWGSIGCSSCKIIVKGLQFLVQLNSSEAEIVKFATYVCKEFGIEDARVCRAITMEFKDEIFGVATGLVLSPEEVCGLLIGEDCGSPYNPESLWNITLPDTPKPPVKPPTPPKPGSPKLRVLHLTDIHLDPKYQPGANSVCGEPLCCRQGDGKAGQGSPAAGVWGDHHDCDAPWVTVENLFQHLSTIQDQFDYVYFTGDLPPHNVWNQTRADQLKSLEVYTQLCLKYLPKKLVFNTLGNHESAPVNSFPPPFITGSRSISWLYSAVAESWKNWLPNNTQADILRGGYYTVLLAEKFRLISLNMNYCNNGNWWLLINTTDPTGQLQWLVQVLQKAEDNKEKCKVALEKSRCKCIQGKNTDSLRLNWQVHILGHIYPGGSNCLKAWSWNYYKIVNRYESTIAGQFFGHSHAVFYEVFYDDVNFTRPTSVLYIPGSVTTYSDLNPGYRIYEVDGFYTGSSWSALDFTNYYLNITEANLTNKPVWKFEYKATEEYEMKNLFPADWSDLIYRMKSNDTLFQVFYRHYTKSADLTPCTGSCKTSILCDLKSGRSHDPNLCKDINS